MLRSRRGSPSKDGWRLILRTLRSQWKGVAVGVIAGLVWTAAKVSVPAAVSKAIDNAIVPGDTSVLWRWTADARLRFSGRRLAPGDQRPDAGEAQEQKSQRNVDSIEEGCANRNLGAPHQLGQNREERSPQDRESNSHE